MATSSSRAQDTWSLEATITESSEMSAGADTGLLGFGDGPREIAVRQARDRSPAREPRRRVWLPRGARYRERFRWRYLACVLVHCETSRAWDSARAWILACPLGVRQRMRAPLSRRDRSRPSPPAARRARPGGRARSRRGLWRRPPCP